MTTRNRVAHTASFLQTFHTGRTTADRRAAVGAEGTEPRPAPADADAVAFVRGQKAATFAQPTAAGEYFAEYRGIRVRHGVDLITEPQAKYVISIALDRDGVTDATLESLKIRLEQGFAKFAASQFISKYKDLPRKSAVAAAIAPVAPTVQPERPTEDGIYVDRESGRIFKLQFNKGQGDGTRLYAKQLVISFYRGDVEEQHDVNLLALDFEGVERRANGKPDVKNSWEYRSGLIAQVRPEWRLTPESAVEWGVLYGSCVRCHRDLTKESSIRQMMGDTCAGKQGF